MEAVKNYKATVQRVQQSRIEGIDFNDIPFGRNFSDHMLVADYKDGHWEQPRIIPYGKMQMAPSNSSLHYGQAIFEGLKAFKNERGETWLFRPEDNFTRLNKSAARMVMPEVPREIFMDGMLDLIRLDQQWVPDMDGSSLYIRPHMFATDEFIGLRPSNTYRFVIITCPSGRYYSEPVGLWATRNMARAVEGGTGEAKTAGNYAGSLLGAQLAKDRGYHNVLWLDGKENRFIEECGTMNMFFVIGGVIVTPALHGTVLHGITRDSVIQMAKDHGYTLEERAISIEEVLEAHASGDLQEAWGVGTAAVISPVDRIGLEDDEPIHLPEMNENSIGNKLLKLLIDIRSGVAPDPNGWMVKI